MGRSSIFLAVLTLLVGLAAPSTVAVAAEDPPDEEVGETEGSPEVSESEPDDDHIVVPLSRHWLHTVMVPRVEFGSGPQVGLGYNSLKLSGLLNGAYFYGAGLDAMMGFRDQRVDSVTGLASARVGRAWGVAGLVLEGSVGAGSGGSDLQPVASAGIYASFLVFEFGYRYQTPVLPGDRPDWLGTHFFGLRGQFSFREGPRQWRDGNDPDSSWESDPDWLDEFSDDPG